MKRDQKNLTERKLESIQAVGRQKLPEWWKDPMDYQTALKEKGKVMMHFRTEAGRYAKRINFRYYRVYESGLMVYVDVTMAKIGVCVSLVVPYHMTACTKFEWEKHFKKMIKQLSL